jgi:Zn ribbon nucleic-acid-binding protein
MTTLTTRPDLDQLRCAECDHHQEPNPGVVLSSACHPDMLSIALYREGELHLECAECGHVWLAVPVAG